MIFQEKHQLVRLAKLARMLIWDVFLGLYRSEKTLILSSYTGILGDI
jgi:hypothetical protein